MIALAASVLMSSAANTQIIDGKILIDTGQARKVMMDAKQVPILKERIQLLKDDIDSFKLAIRMKDLEILQMEYNRSDREAIIANLQGDKDTLREKIRVMEGQLSEFEKLLRKERRQKFWTKVGGIVSTAGAFYLGTRL